MIEKINNSAVTYWILSILTLALTGLLTLMILNEYYIVAIKKDIGGYPFGAEGPVAGIEYYKTADLYAKHTLTTGLIAIGIFILTLYLVLKRKTIGLIIIMILLICYILFNLLTVFNE